MFGILENSSLVLSKCFWLRVHFHHTLMRKAVKFKYGYKNGLSQNMYAGCPVQIYLCNSSKNILGPNVKLSQNQLSTDNLSPSLSSLPQPSSNFDEEISVIADREEEISVIADREEPLPSTKLKLQKNDIFICIKSISSAEELFQFNEENANIMNDQHLVEVMVKLKYFVSNGKEEANIIKENPNFVKLSHSLWKCSSSMDTDELLKMLGSLIELEVPPRSKITQTILQLLHGSMNNLNERELIFLDFILRKCPYVGLTKMLQDAIPLLLDNLLQREVKDDTLSLTDYSKMLAIYANSSGGNISPLLTEIYEHGKMTVNDPVKSILWNILDVQNNLRTLRNEDNTKINVLTEECLDVLSTCLDQVKVGDIIKTLYKLGRTNYRKKLNSSRQNLDFFNAVTQIITTTDCRIRAKCRILSFCLKLRYVSITLNHHVIDEIIKSPDEALNMTDTDLTHLIRALAICGQDHPKLFQSLDILMLHSKIKEKVLNKYWLIFSLDLLSLNYINNDILSLCVNTEYINKYLKEYSLNLLLLDQALVLKKSNFRVPDEFLEHGKKLCLNLQHKSTMLSKLLNEILQDDHFISGVVTNEGIYIDYLLIMNSYGEIQPIEVQKQNKTAISLNDINIPNSSHVVSILDIPSYYVFMPSDQVICSIRLKQQILMAKGYIVVTILDNVIQRLADIEQPSFIKTQLTSVGVNFV